jgi:6-phosphogluconolactonase
MKSSSMKTKIFRTLLTCVALASSLPAIYAQTPASKGDWIAYVGTYTNTKQKSKGIYAYRFDPSNGKFTSIGLVAETSNPSFVALHPNQRFLYAVNENNTGQVSAFAIDGKTGQLKLLNQVSARGSGPCHVAVDKTGKWLFIANYGSGSVASYPIHDDGSLGDSVSFIQHAGSSVNHDRQSGPHGHSANVAPDNRFVLVADLGLDEVLSYKLNAATGALTPNDPPFAKLAPGSGPRHLAFGKDGQFAYVISEMLSTVTAFHYNANRGSMDELQTVSTLAPDFKGTSSCAEIAVHPNGKFVYASNRGADSIALFSIDAKKGTLTTVDRVPTQGKTPRNFAIDPTGAYLFAANQDSDNIVEFRIDANTGRLTPTGGIFETVAPVSIVFANVR